MSHIRVKHKPYEGLPHEALRRSAIYCCTTCSHPYASAKTCANHERDKHNASTTTRPTQPPHQPSPHVHRNPDESRADFFTPNQLFYESLSLTSPTLHEVHTLSCPSIPNLALPSIQAPLRSMLLHALKDLELDAPVVGIYTLTRLLLAPPPAHIPRKELTSIIRARTLQLKDGHAAQLWQSYDWLGATAASVTLPTNTPEKTSKRLNMHNAPKSPSKIFRAQTDAPFLPPTEHTYKLLLNLFPQQPTPELDPTIHTSLPSARARHLPHSPLKSGFIHDVHKRTQIIKDWTYHIAQHPFGSPDGTGMRAWMLSHMHDIKHYIALWLNAILHGRTTSAHRYLLSSKTLRGKQKPNKATGELPRTAEETTEARPLGTHPGIRRTIAGFTAVRMTPYATALYLSLHQYGLIPAGLEVATRKHQLQTDLRPAPFTHAALDVKNAHTSIARCIVLWVLETRFHSTKHPLDHLMLIYFLSYYSEAGPTYIQVGKEFKLHFQYDGLDQGEALAAHAFGYTLGVLLQKFLLPSIPDIVITLVHDDTTLAGYPLNPHTPIPPHNTIAHPFDHKNLTAEHTPLPFAILLFTQILKKYMRCDVAGHKTNLFQQLLTAENTMRITSLAYLFPPGSKISSHGFKLAGVPIGIISDLPQLLTKSLTNYHALLERLHVIPNIPMQLKTLVLTVSCRPTGVFGHFLRAQPPTVTTLLPIPPPEALASNTHASFAHHMRNMLITSFSRTLHISSADLLDSNPNRAIIHQLFLRPRDGGVGFPDPVSIAPAAFLGSLADSLPALRKDPYLKHYLTNTHTWKHQPSPTLRDAARHFNTITAYPTFHNTSQHPICRPIVSLLQSSNSLFTLANLHLIAHRHGQRIFANAIFSRTLEILLHPSFDITPHTRARLRHAAHQPSHLIFALYRITEEVKLSNIEFQHLITHRLGIAPPFVPKPMPAHCQHTCIHYPPHKRLFPPAEYELRHLGEHFMSCNTCFLCLARHNDCTRCIGDTARRETGAHPEYVNNLSSSSTVGTKVDVVLQSFYFTPNIIGLDLTICCPLLPAYQKDASMDARTIFLEKGTWKSKKHATADAPEERIFLPIVITTLGGIGPPEAIDYLDGLFISARADELSRGGTGYETTRRRNLFYTHLHTILVRGTAKMILRLSAPIIVDRVPRPPTHAPAPS